MNVLWCVLQIVYYDLKEVNEMERAPDDFMSKPFKMDVLLEKIEKLLNRKAISKYDIN